VREQKKRLTTRQKRILRSTALVVGVALAAGGAYLYIASAPQRAEAVFQEGMKLMGPGNYARAIDRFDAAVGTWPQHAEAYLQRGNAHKSQGDLDAALADFDQAIEVNPRLAAAHTGRGSILLERGDMKRAMEAFTRAIAIESSTDAYYQRGQAYDALGEHQKAVNDYDQAIAEQREAPYVYRARAMAKRSLGDMAGYEADRDAASRLEHKF
jgi:tetratricopeptide (TPR) repeat protein